MTSAMPALTVEFPMVLLRHTLPDGSWHFDWLLGRCGLDEAKSTPDVRDVVAMRVFGRVDAAAPGPGDQGVAERLPDHRRLYLWHEGEVSGGRGVVERVACGSWRGVLETGGGLRFEARFDGGRWRRWLCEDGRARVG